MSIYSIISTVFIISVIQHVSPRTIDQIIASSMTSSSGPVELNADDGTILVELDMLYKLEDWLEIQDLNAGGVRRRQKRKALRDKKYRWTNNIIPYSIQHGDFNSSDLSLIGAAIADWERCTCLDFRPARSSDRNYVHIHSGDGCWSYVGMIGGKQLLSLGPGCRHRGVIVHELGHAIGFYHEQSRSDRDDHVIINFQNIKEEYKFAFDKYSTDVLNDYGIPYDYKSVMHYGQDYFAKIEGLRTIETRDASMQYTIGNTDRHSFRDIKLANFMYGCSNHCAYKACPGEGFLGKTCHCYCPGNPVRYCY